jgi:hypothetical protein
MANETFTASPALMGFVRIKDQPVRGTMTQELTITASAPPGGAITLAKVGSAAWLTLPTPAEATDGVAFDVTINRDELPKESAYEPVDRTETIRASYAGFDNLDVLVTIKVKPGGPPKIIG